MRFNAFLAALLAATFLAIPVLAQVAGDAGAEPMAVQYGEAAQQRGAGRLRRHGASRKAPSAMVSITALPSCMPRWSVAE